MTPFYPIGELNMGEPGEYHTVADPNGEEPSKNYLQFPENTPDRFIVRL